MAQLWHCRKCGKDQLPLIENGKLKVARFRTGFVGIQLQCRHWVAVNHDKVK